MEADFKMETVPIGMVSREAIASFQCRSPSVEAFLRTRAGEWEKKDWARTFVLLSDERDEPGSPPVLGFYTICMARVTLTDLPADKILMLTDPPNALPAVLLAQVGRDRRIPSSAKTGEVLMGEALRRVSRMADEVGCAGVVLQAENDQLVQYYLRYGYLPLKRARFMFLEMGSVRDGLS